MFKTQIIYYIRKISSYLKCKMLNTIRIITVFLTSYLSIFCCNSLNNNNVVKVSGIDLNEISIVTVLPKKRINKFLDVIITPKEQTIKLPNSKIILNGSTNKDDKITNWHWKVIRGPLALQPKLAKASTLQLFDLVYPGNYTIELTVTDSDKAQNSTTANIIALKATDYPPHANAGPDLILHLPQNSVTLNGTLSADDKGIVAWEWTKVEGKAVDMQNTRTPYLQLSDLQEGIYTFVLKVTDGSNQSDSAKVHVYVKPPYFR